MRIPRMQQAQEHFRASSFSHSDDFNTLAFWEGIDMSYSRTGIQMDG
jgi:hypothetical protein